MSSRNAGTHYVIHPKKSNSYQSGLLKLCLTVMREEHNVLPSPSRAYQAPLLTMIMLTCPHLAVSLHPHAPPCHLTTLPAAQIVLMLPCPLQLHALHHCSPCGCTHHVAVPIMAAHITLPCPSLLHTCVTVLLALAYHLLVHFPISYSY
jgi:hypothetical protein